MTGFAFFISVAQYEDEAFPSYESVRNSARDLHQLFDDSDLWTTCVLIQDPVRPGDVTKRIAEELKNCRSEDAVLVYFVGHGEMPRRGDQHIDLELVMRSSRKIGRSDFLPLHQLYHILEETGASQQTVLLDCCYSGRVASLGSVDDEVFGIRQMRKNSACVLTALRYDELDQTAHARRDAEGIEYTAFSGTLIDLLNQGFADGPEVLDLQRVSDELEYNLVRQGHPQSQLRQSVGKASRVSLLENRAIPRLDQTTREHLTTFSMTALVAEWACPQTESSYVLAQFVGELLRDSERAGGFAHCAHGDDEFERDQQERIVDAIVSGPLDSAGATIGLLLKGACPQCALVGRELLHRMIRVGGAKLTNVDQAVGTISASVKDDALARSAPPRDLVGLTADLIHKPRSETDSARAFELLHAFGTSRSDDEVRQLLVLLRRAVRPLEADTVLGGAVLGRDPDDIAAFVEQVRSIDPELGTAVEVRVARRRPPHVLAAYAATLEDQNRQALLESVTRYRSFNVLVRLAVALHGRGMHPAGREAVRLALTRERTGDAAATVLDVLAADEQGWRSEVVEDVRGFLCTSLPADELWTFFRRHKRLDVLGAVVKERQVHVDDLVVFYHAARADDPDLAAEIATRLAARGKNSSVLLQFLRQGEKDGSGPAEQMLHVLSTRPVEDTVASVLISWNTPANRPERLRENDDALLGRMAESATADNLIKMAQLVAESPQPDLAHRLVRRALAQPGSFAPGDVVTLLSWLSVHRGRNLRKFGHELFNTLHSGYEHQDERFAIPYFAELVAGLDADRRVAKVLHEEIVDRTDGFIAEEEIGANYREYVRYLREFGAFEHAEQFLRRVTL